MDGVPSGTILIPPKSEWLELTATKESENYQLRYSLEWASPMAHGKESACKSGDAGDMGSIPGLVRYFREGHGNLLQCSCLENPMDRGALWAIVHRVAYNWTQLKQLGT